MEKRLKRMIDIDIEFEAKAESDRQQAEKQLRILRTKSFEIVKLADGSILSRLMVPGGWLVIYGGYREKNICFYPDKDHKWEVGYDPMEEWCWEPEDLKDDWPHASIVLLEAA